jgi:hypothetical protein
MLKTIAKGLELDCTENAAVNEFVAILDEQQFQPKPLLLPERIHRTLEGTIVIPVSLKGKAPSLSLALLMAHKAEQLYKRSTCRMILAQCPVQDPEQVMYVWGDRNWQTLP